MTIKLSAYWRTTAWTMWILAALAFAGLIIFHVAYAEPGEILWVMVVCGVFYILLAIILPLLKWRALMTIKIEGNEYTSYYFKKACCTVSATRTVYYDFFIHREGSYSTKKCILISNKPFRSLEQDVPHIHFFDTETQIAIPYNQTTIGYLDLESWQQVTSQV